MPTKMFFNGKIATNGKPYFVQALAVVSVVAAGGALRAGELKHYESGNKDFWTHPPDDWFLGDENEAQKGLAPPSGPPTGASEAELASLIKKELGVILRYPDYRAGLAAILADETCRKMRRPASSTEKTHPG